MKYFTYSLICSANGWTDDSPGAEEAAMALLDDASERYKAQLDSLRGRVSKPAWNFFRHGFAETGLHDARLVSFAIGDGLSWDESKPFDINRQWPMARATFLNFDQTHRYVFEMRGVRKCGLEYEKNREFPHQEQFGDLYVYELSEADGGLELSFLFANGAEITVEFKKLVFRRHRSQAVPFIGKGL